MNYDSERYKCTRCKVNLPIDHYTKKRNGDRYKTCMQCIEKNKKYKCSHGKQKNNCKE